MKTANVLRGILGGIVLSGGMVLAAEVVEKTTTTTYSGTMSEVSPGSSTIVVKSETSSAPVTYKYNKTTTWVDSSGNVITSEQARNSPVTVYYAKDGESTIVTKVVASKPSMTKETTTTTTKTVE
jgi:hypothetical protein